jgi:hypothetical protein
MSALSQVSGPRAAAGRAGADGGAEGLVDLGGERAIAQGLAQAARAIEFLGKQAPCADPATTTEWAAARNTRETRRVHRPPAAVRD